MTPEQQIEFLRGKATVSRTIGNSFLSKRQAAHMHGEAATLEKIAATLEKQVRALRHYADKENWRCSSCFEWGASEIEECGKTGHLLDLWHIGPEGFVAAEEALK